MRTRNPAAPRSARPCATRSPAISAAAPVTVPSSRRAGRAPRLPAAARGLWGERPRLERLAALPAGSTRLVAQGRRFFAPATASELAEFLAEHPAATLLAGGTD